MSILQLSDFLSFFVSLSLHWTCPTLIFSRIGSRPRHRRSLLLTSAILALHWPTERNKWGALPSFPFYLDIVKLRMMPRSLSFTWNWKVRHIKVCNVMSNLILAKKIKSRTGVSSWLDRNYCWVNIINYSAITRDLIMGTGLMGIFLETLLV